MTPGPTTTVQSRGVSNKLDLFDLFRMLVLSGSRGGSPVRVALTIEGHNVINRSDLILPIAAHLQIDLIL